MRVCHWIAHALLEFVRVPPNCPPTWTSHKCQLMNGPPSLPSLTGPFISMWRQLTGSGEGSWLDHPPPCHCFFAEYAEHRTTTWPLLYWNMCGSITSKSGCQLNTSALIFSWLQNVLVARLYSCTCFTGVCDGPSTPYLAVSSPSFLYFTEVCEGLSPRDSWVGCSRDSLYGHSRTKI